MKRPRYWVKTWDTDKQEFTPQRGVRCGPYSLFGLRRALRKLQGMGYACNYHGESGGDPSVRVYREDLE